MIRFYWKGKYMGWIKPTSFSLQFLRLSSWITSGGDLKYKDKLINDTEYINKIYTEE